MKRTEILHKLDTVLPALAANDMIPILGHFWFRGDRLMAYSDQIAISTKLPAELSFKGAVPAMLRDLLRHSKAKEVTFTVKEKELQIKASISTLKLAVLPADDFMGVFDMPKPSKDEQSLEIKAVGEFLDAIESCMRSVTNDTTTPDQLGVTLIPQDGRLHMFATDSVTLSHAEIDMPTGSLKARPILAGAFCREMLRMAAGAKKAFSLRVTSEYALLTLANGDMLFGKLIHSEHPVSFMDIYNHHFPPKIAKTLVPIPTALEGILDRACIVADTAKTRTQVTVAAGRMRFVSKAPQGEVSDSMQIHESHPEISASLEAKLLRNGYGNFAMLAITEKAAIMTSKDKKLLYMISATED